MDRRRFLNLLAAGPALSGIAGSFAAESLPGPYTYTPFSADFELPAARTLDEVVEMTPHAMATASPLVSGAYNELLAVADSLEREDYRALMHDILRKPRATFLELYPAAADRERIVAEGVKRGYFIAGDNADYLFPPGHDNIQTMLTSPQSHNEWYGSHPGGMALVVSVNVRIADAHSRHYREVYRVPVDRDIAACALGIHEFPKSWFLQWREDGSYGHEPRSLYGVVVHTHAIYITAELMHRRVDAALTAAVAVAHSTGTVDVTVDGRETKIRLTGPEVVVKIIEAAAMLAQVDPVNYGLLRRKADGSHALEALTAEQWSAHLGDMNWPYTLGAAHPTGKAFLQQLAVQDYGISEADIQQFPYTRAFNQLKNYVWSQVGEIGLYEVLQREGDAAARRFVNRLVTPV